VGDGSLFQGSQDLIGKKTRHRESRHRKNSRKGSQVVRAGSLFQGRQHLIGKKTCQSQNRKVSLKASGIVDAGSLFQGRQHLPHRLVGSLEPTRAGNFVVAPQEVLARQQVPAVEGRVFPEADQGYPHG
jgi:hypothetical protein